VIERTYGVIKKRFKILSTPQEYSITDQARLVSALAVVHNFIQMYDPDMDEEDDIDNEDTDSEDGNGDTTEAQGNKHIPKDDRGRAAERRDQIAQAMWRKYRP
jgi:hypothetical protein